LTADNTASPRERLTADDIADPFQHRADSGETAMPGRFPTSIALGILMPYLLAAQRNSVI
jgi:hypothetical protein